MNLTPGGLGDKAGAEAADTPGMTDQPVGLSAEREEELRRRLASGYYGSAEVLDRLALCLVEVLRRRG